LLQCPESPIIAPSEVLNRQEYCRMSVRLIGTNLGFTFHVLCPAFAVLRIAVFASASICSSWRVLGVRNQSAVARKVQHTQTQSDHCNRQSRAQKHTHAPLCCLQALFLSHASSHIQLHWHNSEICSVNRNAYKHTTNTQTTDT